MRATELNWGLNKHLIKKKKKSVKNWEMYILTYFSRKKNMKQLNDDNLEQKSR